VSREPRDPVSFESAVTELWERLAANSGFNLKEHRLRSLDDLPPEQAAELERDDAQLASLRDEAWEWLWGLALTEGLRVWIDEDQRWKRLSLQAVRGSLYSKADDEPWGVYLDREEIAALAERRWPTSEDLPTNGGTSRTFLNGGSNKRPGRPSGSGGYAKDDEPLLMEMHLLIQSGQVGSVHAAAVQVAHKARGTSTSPEGKVRRLCDRYKGWRRQIGA
jgi:hypothetical protein